MRGIRLLTVFLFCAAGIASADPAAVTPATFATKANFTIGNTVLQLSTAIATLEPRPGAQGYSWLTVNFYSVPVEQADLAAIEKGDVKPVKKKWSALSGKSLDAYNTGNAMLRLTVDEHFAVTQVDLAVPGHSCTVASDKKEMHRFMQNYSVSAAAIALNTKGTYSCDLSSMHQPNETYGWNIDLKTPVFRKSNELSSKQPY